MPKSFGIFILCLGLIPYTWGQTPLTNSLQSPSIPALQDTLNTQNTDTLAVTDSIPDESIEGKEARWGVKISRDALPSKVESSSQDSSILNLKTNIFSLHGNAKINYEDIKLQSAHILYHQKSNELFAYPELDSNHKKISTQQFTQAEQNFSYDTLRYNFISKRAIVRNAYSQYGEGFIISEMIKRNKDESIFGFRNLYTTCNLPHPHFGIRTKRIKVIPKRMVASGPANLEIADIPTPLFLPFGIFPINDKQSSGFIIPSYTMEANRGLGLQRGGYYFNLGSYLGLTLQTDIFSRGSWGFFSNAQYVKRYQYQGNFSFDYTYTKIGESFEQNGSIAKDFRLIWSHRVDPRARPGSSFSASVNVGSSTYNLFNGLDAASTLNNQYSSSINYSKTWIGKPYSLSVALRHSQSTYNRMVTLNLPEIAFNVGQFSPFQRKNMVGSPRWYEKITASYGISAKNEWSFYDSTFSLSNVAFNDFRNGILHTASVQATYNVLRFFNFNISMPYKEYWNTNKIQRQYNPQTMRYDTLSNEHGFYATRDFSFSAGLSTRIYGVKMFKKGRVQGIRHVITPSISATYQPGFAERPFEYYYPVQVDANGNLQYESPYFNSIIGYPSPMWKSGAIGFGLSNTLAMKVRSKDTTEESKNINLIDRLSINTSYDLFRDSNKLAPITLNATTSLFGKLSLSANASFDPYKYDNGVRTGTYLLQAGEGLVKFRQGNIGLSMNFSGAGKNNMNRDSMGSNSTEQDQINRLIGGDNIREYHDFNIPWNFSMSASLSIVRHSRASKEDTIIYTPNVSFYGGFNLTERWKINIQSGLTFRGSKVEPGYTNISISRDLHCWQMSLNLVPFGALRSFNFILQVKASVLQDLKLTRRRSVQDSYYSY